MESTVTETANVATTEARLGGATWLDLYEQHGRYIFYLALRATGDHALAQDVTHDVFLKAFRHLDEFRGQASPRTWLYRITINHCRNLQSRWQNRHIVATENFETLDSQPNLDSPLRILEVKELGERIQKALDVLPEEYRWLLLLVADERLSYQEVGELTDQSADAVRGKLYRARKAFLIEFQKTE
jgi:RNA polymerase sigma-70 factor, ECF subfamily